MFGEGVTSKEQFGSMGESVLNVKVDFGERSSVDEGTVGGRSGERRTEGEGGDWEE